MMKYVINASVKSVQELFYDRYVSGVGKDAQFQKVSRGWFVGLHGSYELLYIGDEKPDIKVGDAAIITVTFPKKEPSNANP